MALVTIVEVPEHGTPSMVFYAEVPTMDDGIVAILENEEKCAERDWVAEVEYRLSFYREYDSVQISMVDNGSDSVVSYVYTVTA